MKKLVSLVILFVIILFSGCVQNSGTIKVKNTSKVINKVDAININQIGKPFLNVGHTKSVNSIAIQGDYIVSGSLDKTIKLWSIKSGRLIKTFKGLRNKIYSVAIRGDYIVSGSSD